MAAMTGRVRLAAMSDIHVGKTGQGALSSAFAHVSERADLLVLCGDLTDYGLPEEARVLARDVGTALRVSCRALDSLA
jgi:Icc-related predicted phosphoesterase